MPETPQFPAYLRKAREKSGLTQAAVATACGLTGSYISLLESGRKPAPSDRVVRKLASALDLDVEEALRTAHLDRAPRDLRADVDRLRRQAAMERDLRERTADALFPLSLWSLYPAGQSRRLLGANTGSLGADLVGIFQHLVDLAGSSPDLDSFRRRSGKVLNGLKDKDRKKVLEAAPDFIAAAGKAGGIAFREAPEGGLPPDIKVGDRIGVDASLAPAEGEPVLVERNGAVSLHRWTAGMEGVVGVVVEVRRRLR